MSDHDIWVVECPHCQKEIKEKVSWFKAGKLSCTSCAKDFSPEEVEDILANIKVNLIDPEEEIEFNF